MDESRFIIGIDLGTTNTVMYYLDTEESTPRIKPFKIPQFVASGEVDSRVLFPSFCYLPTMEEKASGIDKLPWSDDPAVMTGVWARDRGARTPTRIIASTKSWLAHAGVDRLKPILPWGSELIEETKSPVEVSSLYLRHLKNAWNHHFKNTRDRLGSWCYLEDQQVIITIPASFDETARQLTLEASLQAGYQHVVLVEEPLAAFYSWLFRHEDDWCQHLTPGEKILVVDIGGGTTDFTIVTLDHNETLRRTAVGDHLLLGGDNLDMTIARKIEKQWGQTLSTHEWTGLCMRCREAKETLLSSDQEQVEITLLMPGSSVLRNLRKAILTRGDIETILETGFLPQCPADSQLNVMRSGIRTMGLPYATNPAITEHLLLFLRYAAKLSHDSTMGPASGTFSQTHSSPSDITPAESPYKPSSTPSIDSETESQSIPRLYPGKVLFNGGSMIPESIRSRLLTVIASWFPDYPPPQEIKGEDYSLAVANGAVYYGWTRRGKGVKVKSGIARSFYLETLDSDDRSRYICVMARDTDENLVIHIPGQYTLMTNQNVQFKLASSATRLHDLPGNVVPDSDELTFIAPLITQLQYGKSECKSLKVKICSRLTEAGTLAIALHSCSTEHIWPLQFDLRSIPESTLLSGSFISFDARQISTAMKHVTQAFRDQPGKITSLVGDLEKYLGQTRDQWPLIFIRQLVDTMLQLQEFRGQTDAHETRWYNLMGLAMRPGFGDPSDTIRMRELWKIWFQEPVHKRQSQVLAEWWVLWRRIAPGLKSGQQITVANKVIKILCPRNEYRSHIREGVQAQKEMWRCLGALEHLPADKKAAVGNLLLGRKAPLQDYDYWVLARLGARVLFRAPANTILPTGVAEIWIKQLASNATGSSPRSMHLFALARIAARCGDRKLDVHPAVYQEVREFLTRHKCPTHWLDNMASSIPDHQQTMKELLVDSIPVGLKISSFHEE